MKILMGVDGSAFSGGTLKAIVSNFRPENTEILVLHVLQPIAPSPPQMNRGYAPELEGEREPAHDLVEQIANELRRAGFRASTAVEIGDIRQGIIDAAAEWLADLIVVGSRGRRGIERILLGSVSEFLARHSKCSVYIVRMSEEV
jgi:nucleotide-binding universal stress UspA family protein